MAPLLLRRPASPLTRHSSRSTRTTGSPRRLCKRRGHHASGSHCTGHRQCRLWLRIQSISGIGRARRSAGGTGILYMMGSRAARSRCMDSRVRFRGGRMGSRGAVRAVRQFLLRRCGTGWFARGPERRARRGCGGCLRSRRGSSPAVLPTGLPTRTARVPPGRRPVARAGGGRGSPVWAMGRQVAIRRLQGWPRWRG